MQSSRRQMLKLAGVGGATAAACSLVGTAHAQVAEQAGTDPLQITRKGINKDLQVINTDVLEEQAKASLPEGVYVFISHCNGDQWTLRENRRACPGREGGRRWGP